MIDIQSKIIDQFPNYRIYEDGRVQNIKTNRFLKPGINGHGYLSVVLSLNGRMYSNSIHRLLAQEFISNPENKPCVNHIDGNKLNNSLDNLEWVTYSENILHAYRIGLNEAARKTSKFNGLLTAKLILWTHSEHGYYYCSASELVRLFPNQFLDQGHLSKVSIGKRISHKGWKTTI